MRARFSIALAACVLGGCENPQGQTERFLAEAAKGIEEKELGKVPPLPSFKPREVSRLVIERDPFKR